MANQLDTIKNMWDSLSYDEQQVKLKETPNLQQMLSKYGLVAKTAPSTPTQTSTSTKSVVSATPKTTVTTNNTTPKTTVTSNTTTAKTTIDGVEDIKNMWDSLSYEEQQAKLQSNPNLQKTISKYGFTVKSAEATQQGSNSLSPAVNKSIVDAYYDANHNLHYHYSDGSSQIIPGGLTTSTYQEGGASGLSEDKKTYTFQQGYEPLYPQGEITGDKSTSIANVKGFQTKSKTLDYQSDSQERYNQILSNLDTYYTTHPEYFTDRSSFDANFQIDQRSIGQQQLMVEWFYAKKKQERDYNAISGLNNGQAIYDAVNGGGLTNDQLDLLKGTPQYGEYLSILQDKVNLATINNDPSMFFVNSMPATLEDLRDEIMATIGEMDEYNMWEYMLSLYDGEDYERVRDRVEKSTQEALLIKAEYDSIDSNVRNRLEGTGATKAYINAVIAREQNDLIPRVNTAYAQLQADQTNYNLRHQSVEDKYKSYYDQAHYEIQKYNAQVNAFQTMWGIYKDVAQYDWNYKQQVRLTQLQESYNNPMLDSDDPDEARRALKQALQGYYDTYGQIIKRDINQVMQDVYNYAKKNNVSLATALQKNFVDQLKAKPEYKELTKQYMYGREYLYQKAGTATSGSSKSSTSSSKSTATTTPNGGGVTPSASWWSQTSESEPTRADYEEVSGVLNGFINASGYSEGDTGGQCGHYVNQYLNQLGFGLGNIKDSIEDKVSLINDSNPEIGSILVMDSKTAPENGHVAIVTGINLSNGFLIVQDSNWKSDGKIRIHELNPNSKNIRGYINPAKAIAYNNFNGENPSSEFVGASGTIHKLNQEGFIDALTPNYKYYNDKGEIASTASEAQALLKDYGISREQFVAQAKNYTIYGSEARAYAQDLIDQYRKVSDLYNMIGSYNALKDTFGIGNSDQFRAKFNQLKNKISLGYFTDVRSRGVTFGSTTEAEWKLVGQASSELGNRDGKVDLQLHKDAIAEELLAMRDSLKNVILGLPVYQHSIANKSTTNSMNTSSTTNNTNTSNPQSSGRGSDR